MAYVGTFRARVKRHLFDWVLLIALIVALCVLATRHEGFRREFSLQDTSLQFPHAEHERVPTWALVVISLIAPLVIIICLPAGLDKPLYRIHYGVLGLAITYCFTGTITNIIKLCAGRPRPDLLDRCQPTTNISAYHGQLVTDSICTTPLDSKTLSDGFKSFPSGHSSSAFCGMVYLGFYVRHILWNYAQRYVGHRYESSQAFASTSDVSDTAEPETALLHGDGSESVDERGRSIVLFGAVVQLLLLLAATLVGVSRTMDYRHHSTDVLAGGIIGSLVAVFIFHVYHPMFVPRVEMLR